MAPRVTYKRQGLRVRVPEFIPANAQAQQRGLSQLSASMDRMSRFFGQQHETESKIAGAEYGARNAPTLEQIQAAKTSGQDLELPGDTSTAFGRAARNAALQLTSDNMELAAKEKINSIILQGENAGTNPATIEDQIDAVIHGFGAAFDDTSPMMAKQFRARMGVYGNAKYANYHSSYITKAQAQAKANWQASLLLTLDSIPDMLKNGVTEKLADGTEKTVALTSESLAATKEIILNDAISYRYSASEIKVLEKAFDDAVVNGAKQLIGNAVLDSLDPYMEYKQISRNDAALPDNIKLAIGLLSNPDDRSAVIEMARNAWLRTVNDKVKLEEERKAIRERLIRQYDNDANKALLDYQDDPEAAVTSLTQAIADMRGQDAGKARELEEMLVKIEGREPFALTSNQTTIFAIDSKINDFDLTLTLADLNQHLLNNELSYKDWKAYSTTVRARMDTNFAEALTETRKRLQLPTGMVADRSVLDTWQWNTLNKIELAMRKARRDSEDAGQSFNAIDWLDENFDAMAQPEQDSWVDAALNDLTGYTRSSLTRQINAATNEDVKASLLRLLTLADRLEDEGLLPAEFNQ